MGMMVPPSRQPGPAAGPMGGGEDEASYDEQEQLEEQGLTMIAQGLQLLMQAKSGEASMGGRPGGRGPMLGG
jgi:hypothetical protein